MMRQRTLLDDIRSEISAAGGRYKLAAMLIRESPEWFNHHDKAVVKKALCANNRSRTFKKKNPKQPKSNRNRIWSDEDTLYLRKHYGRVQSGKLARILNRSRAALALKFAAVASESEKEWVEKNGIHSYMRINLKKK